MQRKEQLDNVVKEIRKVAKSLGKNPATLTRGEFLRESDIAEWQVRKLGGYNSVLKAHFPITDKDLATMSELNEAKAYISKLEKKLGSKELFEENILDQLVTKLDPIPKIKLRSPAKRQKKIRRVLTTMLNDTHFGLQVDSDEVNGLNSFDWTVASRRVAMLLEQIIEYKKHRRDEVEQLNIVLNGDIIAGLIHGLATQQQDLLIHQINGTTHILTQFLAKLLTEFPKILVSGISGNHGDSVHKREGGKRVLQEKYDSYENIIYYALSVAFRDNPRITFNLPKTPYLFLDLLGHRCMAAHGDTLFSKALGNPGSSINVKSLGNEIRKFNSGETLKGNKPVSLVLFGHVHTYAHFSTEDGIEVYVAPSLSGVDAYAHTLNVNVNNVAQVIFESTEDYVMGDARLVDVASADNDKRYDQVISPFKRDLKYKK